MVHPKPEAPRATLVLTAIAKRGAILMALFEDTNGRFVAFLRRGERRKNLYIQEIGAGAITVVHNNTTVTLKLGEQIETKGFSAQSPSVE